MKLTDRLCLGTAQFGSDYGIANVKGKVSREEAFEILNYAYDSGIRYLDTAFSYGDSEDIIGEFISKSGKEFKVISKIPVLRRDAVSPVEKYCAEMSSRFGRPGIYGCLVHNFDNILTHKDLWPLLESLKKKGSFFRIGFSLYKTEELKYLLDNEIRFDIAQVPYNVFDQRFEDYFPALKKMGAEIYARSVFLQGLFFLTSSKIDKNFHSAKRALERLRGLSSRHEIPINALCLCFALSNPLVDKVIMGIDSMGQLNENLDSLEYYGKTCGMRNELRSLIFHDEKVILPCNWN